MQILDGVIFGFVQGVTEFLPVSSSGHLFLLQMWKGMEPSITLEILLHVGTLIAVIGFFFPKICKILREMFRRGGDSLGWKLLLATFLTAPTGILMHNFFTGEITMRLVGITLLITAALIVLEEWLRPKKTREFTRKVTILLGLVQGLAVLPGISRSGLTIAFLILIGLPRKESAEISFILAIPTILGALVFSFGEADFSTLTSDAAVWIAFVVSAVAAVGAIAWMLKLIQGKWIWFAPYCALLGVWLLF
jgi:undecaprenyl-diphosphatase